MSISHTAEAQGLSQNSHRFRGLAFSWTPFVPICQLLLTYGSLLPFPSWGLLASLRMPPLKTNAVLGIHLRVTDLGTNLREQVPGHHGPRLLSPPMRGVWAFVTKTQPLGSPLIPFPGTKTVGQKQNFGAENHGRLPQRTKPGPSRRQRTKARKEEEWRG